MAGTCIHLAQINALCHGNGLQLMAQTIADGFHVGTALVTANARAQNGLRQIVADIPGRHTEIDMFSGALMRMGQELGIPTPYNEYTYHMIKALEEKNDGLFDYAAKASDLTCAK